MKKNSNKNNLLILSLIVFFSFSLSILIFSPVSFVNIAKALNPSDYNKSSGQTLGVIDWNRLDSDFFAKSGDTMTGPINMANNQITNIPDVPVSPTDAVNKNFVLSQLAAANSISDTSGNDLKVLCGRTVKGATSWVPFLGGAYVDIDISMAGFTSGSKPYIFTSLGGIGYHWLTRGVSSIYSQVSATDDIDSDFRIYVMNDTSMTFSNSYINYQWYVNWCAFGY